MKYEENFLLPENYGKSLSANEQYYVVDMTTGGQRRIGFQR